VYIYDAIGTKLKKSFSETGSVTGETYYAGMFEYDKNKALTLIHTDEGVVNYAGGAFTYEFFLKDHLGNTRATF
jgi:hypothetical protein